MSTRKPDEILQFFMKMIADEQCVAIRPHMDNFRPVQRDFLDGLRRIPAQITAPPGVNPFSYAMGKPGQWVMIWIPE
jgi:hypothetical protein